MSLKIYIYIYIYIYLSKYDDTKWFTNYGRLIVKTRLYSSVLRKVTI
jgi:hypothetical protein